MSISDLGYDQVDIEQLKPKRLVVPKKVKRETDWTLTALQEHLQWAIDIEFFTIPFYMSAMYSIKDQASEARRLIRTVVNQEMLHMQSAANVANAFGTEVHLSAPAYGGTIPHLDFSLDHPNPTQIFSPYSTAIGPCDVERINAMCIVEYPNWNTCTSSNKEEYGSIGEFYASVRKGAKLLAENIQGGRNQVTHFSSLYPNAPTLCVTKSGKDGLPQVSSLIDLIVSQGEGQGESAEFIPREFQNSVDDLQPQSDHFQKFTYLRGQPLPETFPIGFGSARGAETQAILLKNFANLLEIMNKMFSGEAVQNFGPVMFKVGASIAACWEQGVIPIYSAPSDGGDS